MRFDVRRWSAPSGRLSVWYALAAFLVVVTCATDEPADPGDMDPGPGPDTTAATIDVVSGNDQTAQTNTALGAPFVVVVKTAGGTGLADRTVAWTVQAGGGMLASPTSVTAVGGQASVMYTLGSTAGVNTVRATIQGTAVTTDFNATATAPPIDPVPATLTIVSGNNQSAAVSTALAQPLVVVVKNGGGDALQNVVVAWAVTAGGGNVASPTSVTGATGQASNTFTVASAAGSSTIEAAVQSNTAINKQFTATATAVVNGTVNVQDNSFSPSDVTVSKGGKVTWTWVGSNPHNVTWVAGGLAGSSTQTTGTHDVTFAASGTFAYYCTIHGSPSSGMRGTVNVP